MFISDMTDFLIISSLLFVPIIVAVVVFVVKKINKNGENYENPSLHEYKYSDEERLNPSQYEKYLKQREKYNHIVPAEYIREFGKEITLTKSEYKCLLSDIKEPLKRKDHEKRPFAIGLAVTVVVLLVLVPSIVLTIVERKIENMTLAGFMMLLFAFAFSLDYTGYKELKRVTTTKSTAVENNQYEVYELEITSRKRTGFAGVGNFILESGDLMFIVNKEQYRKYTDKVKFCLLINAENEITDYFLV